MGKPQLRGGSVVPGAGAVLGLELRVPLLGSGEVAEVAAGGLEAKLQRRVGAEQRPVGGQPLANLQAALVPVPRLRQVSQGCEASVPHRLGAAGLRLTAARALLGPGLPFGLGGGPTDGTNPRLLGRVVLLDRPPSFPEVLLRERALAYDQELAQLVASARLAAGVVADQPAVRLCRERVSRVAVHHEQERFMGERPLSQAGA